MKLPILLLCAAPLLAQYGPCSVSGVVLREDTGEPVARARLLFNAMGRVGMATLGYFTDDQGRFEAFGLDPTNYAVSVQKNGFAEVEQGEMVVRLGGRCTAAGLRYLLAPAAVLSGRIVDRNGRPQGMATVDAMRRAWVRGRWQFTRYSSAVADAEGRYRLAGLPLGTYALRVHPTGPSSVRYGEGGPLLVAVPAFFPGVYEEDRAQLIQVNTPGELGGFDFGSVMTTLFRVEGNVTPADGHPMPVQCYITLRSADAGARTYPVRHVPGSGSFTATGIPPGSYRLTVYGADAEGVTSGVLPLELQGSDALGLTVALQAPTRVEGVARLSSGRFAAGAWFKLKPATALPATDDAGAVDAEGRFEFSAVLHERYHLAAGSSQGSVYLQSIIADGRPVEGSRLDWTVAPPRRLEVVLGDDGGSVEGTVRTRSQEPVRGYYVALVPADLSKLAGAEVLAQPTQANGRFHITNVPPGDYYAYAFAFPMRGRENPDMLADPLWVPGYRGRPTTVHVAPRGQATADLDTQPLP